MMRFDFHIHSMYSYDSISKVMDIIKKSKKAGLNGIAITDHETIKGAQFARKYSDNEFMVITGCEINTEIGDIIGLFLNEEIKSRRSVDVIDEVKAQGGLVVFPHPFRGHKWDLISAELLNNIDVIEGFNSRNQKEENVTAIKLAEERKIPMIAGSDAHLIHEIGNAFTIFPETEMDIDCIQKIISNNKINRELTGINTPIYSRIISNFVRTIKKRGVCGIPGEIVSLSYKGTKKVLRDYKNKNKK